MPLMQAAFAEHRVARSVSRRSSHGFFLSLFHVVALMSLLPLLSRSTCAAKDRKARKARIDYSCSTFRSVSEPPTESAI
eukprot:scaffold7329_cov222-Pinguiococcus_pyrenoidosus.AAC.8